MNAFTLGLQIQGTIAISKYISRNASISRSIQFPS
jgi:hypothetical protein